MLMISRRRRRDRLQEISNKRNQEPQEVTNSRQQGQQGVRQDYANSSADAANAQAYADWAAQNYVSKYGDTGRNDTAGSTRSEDIARGADDLSGQNKKAKRLFSDMVGSITPVNLISA